MAQIIKHRRGSISALKDVTANIGEFVIATGSIGDLNAPVVFVGSDATAGGYRAVSKIYQGSIAPILGAGYGSTMDGTPFYSSTSQSLYILDRNGNINMDLSGNLEGNTISGITINNITGSRATFDTFVSSSALNVTGNTQMGGTLNVEGSTTINNNLTVTGTTNANGPLNVTGSVNISGNTSMTGALVVSDGSATFNQGLVAQNSDLLLTSGSNIKIQDGGNLQVAGDASVSGALYVSGNIYQTGSFYTQGDIILSGSINIGDNLTGDTINFGGEINSNIIPTTNNTYDLGSSAKAWKDLYVSGTAHIGQLNLGSIQLTNLDLPGYLNVTGATTLYSATTINADLTVTGNTTVSGDFLANGSNSTLTANFGGNNIELNAYNGATIDLNGPTTINGGLTVTGTTNVNSSLNVTGATTLYSATTINAGLTVTGTTDLNGPLNVTGATTLYSATTINSDLTVTGNTTLSGSVYVEDLTEKRLVVAGTNGLLTNYSGLTFDNGNLNVSGAIEVTNIQGTGSLYLKPDLDDPRLFEIYNSAGPSGYTDIHFVGNADLNFFGDDTNYLKIDDTAQTVSIVGVNGVFVSSSLTVTGSVNVNGNTSLTGSLTVASGSATMLGGDLFVSGNLQVLGSQTNVNIESHTVDIGDNIIQVNAYSPFQRYAGLSAYDSGSVGDSGSLLWDSTNDYWLFQNANGTSSKIVGVSGGTFGSEASLTSGTFPIATTGNTIGDSLLTYSGTTLSLNGKFSVDSGSGETKIQGNLNISYSGATMTSGVTSNVLFINSNDDIGFIGSTDTTSVTDRLLGYNTSTGNLEFSSLIDGGQY
jgi:cytoskeletal protein CcmA (bactofilin family)